MPAEDNRSGAQASLGKPPADHYSLDALAKGLASQSVSRGQALRMVGARLLTRAQCTAAHCRWPQHTFCSQGTPEPPRSPALSAQFRVRLAGTLYPGGTPAGLAGYGPLW